MKEQIAHDLRILAPQAIEITMAVPKTDIQVLEDGYIPEPMSGCWLWVGGCVPKGYGTLRRRGKTYRASRFSWELHKGTIPAGLHVLHKCDVPACVNPDHLFLGTNLDNVRDMDRKGRRPKQNRFGEHAPFVKLTAEQVREIRASTDRTVTLAQRYGVNVRTIRRIITFVNWPANNV